MTCILIFTSIFRPYQVAFSPQTIYIFRWNVINFVVEVLFLIDILVVFNTPYYTEDFKLIESRKMIANNYLFG